MSNFATGKNAYAISDRSGFRYRYKDMRKEWNGLLVGRDEYETKQPQLGPFRKVSDPQALKDARPPQDSASINAIQWGWNPVGYSDYFNLAENYLVAQGSVGVVTVVTT
tara:strand:- start:471 stop:797 length:327 start_codon:yes stop_codon:yes gene_type:complete